MQATPNSTRSNGANGARPHRVNGAATHSTEDSKASDTNSREQMTLGAGKPAYGSYDK